MLVLIALAGVASAAPSDWSDLSALFDGVERDHRAEIAKCVPADQAPKLATFIAKRGKDGAAEVTLVIHHSLGYLGYSKEERCLQKIAIALPAMPEALESVAFTLAPATSSATGDVVKIARDRIAAVRSRLDACGHAESVVFERRGTRIVLARPSSRATRCAARVAADIAVPDLPAHVDRIVVRAD